MIIYKDVVSDYVKKNLTKSSTLKKMQKQVERGVIKLADDFKNEGQNAFDYMFHDLEETLLKTRSFHLFSHFIICYTHLLNKEITSNITTFNLDKNYTFDTRVSVFFEKHHLDERTTQFIIDNFEERFKSDMHEDLRSYAKKLMSETLLPAVPYKNEINTRYLTFIKDHPLDEYLKQANNNQADEYLLNKYEDIQRVYEKWMLENDTVTQVNTNQRKKYKI